MQAGHPISLLMFVTLFIVPVLALCCSRGFSASVAIAARWKGSASATSVRSGATEASRAIVREAIIHATPMMRS